MNVDAWIRPLNDAPVARGRYVLYWMQQSQRARSNHALEHAIRTANDLDLAENAAVVVCDQGYLRHQKRWRRRVAQNAGRRVVEVESDVVVPVDEASATAETVAHTIRPTIQRLRDKYARNLAETKPVRRSLRLEIDADVELKDVAGLLAELPIDRSVPSVQRFRGGTRAARARRQLRGTYLRQRQLPMLAWLGTQDARGSP